MGVFFGRGGGRRWCTAKIQASASNRECLILAWFRCGTCTPFRYQRPIPEATLPINTLPVCSHISTYSLCRHKFKSREHWHICFRVMVCRFLIPLLFGFHLNQSVKVNFCALQKRGKKAKALNVCFLHTLVNTDIGSQTSFFFSFFLTSKIWSGCATCYQCPDFGTW